jgi:hypothetical protein
MHTVEITSTFMQGWYRQLVSVNRRAQQGLRIAE